MFREISVWGNECSGKRCLRKISVWGKGVQGKGEDDIGIWASMCNFYTLQNFSNFLVLSLIGNDIVIPTQCIHSMPITKTCCTIICFSSVEAYLLWKYCSCLFGIFYHMLLNVTLEWQELWKLCNKSSNRSIDWNSSSSDSFQQTPGSWSISRAPRGPVAFWWPMWGQGSKTVKTAKLLINCKMCHYAQNVPRNVQC